MGLKFRNDLTGSINYGYVKLTTTAPDGFPATITGRAYENTGAAITVPGTPSATPGSPSVAPEPATWAMMIAGFGLVGAATRRRRGQLV